MIRRLIVPFIVLLVLASCVTGPPPLQPGQKLNSGYKIGSLPAQLALPDGNWEVAEYTTYTNSTGTLIVGGLLIEREKNLVRRAVSFISPAYGNQTGYQTRSLCSRDDVHFRETTTDLDGGDQDCVFVNHYRPTYQGSSNARMRAIGNYLQQQGLEQPNHLIQVGYRLADNISFMNLEFFFNPVAEGFPSYPRTTWQASPWHPTSVAGDQDKKKYIGTLIEWAKSHRDAVRQGFEGKLKSTAAMQSPATTSHDALPRNSIDPGERLKTLKSLLDDGAISQEEYNKKRAEIVDGL